MKTTAKSRVLAALQAGPQTTGMLCQPDVGGVRFGARLMELRDEGHRILERRLRAGSSLYTLVAAPAPVRTGPRTGPSGRGHENPWHRAWMCPRCAYRVVDGPECPHGHQAVKGWTGDFTRPHLTLVEAA